LTLYYQTRNRLRFFKRHTRGAINRVWLVGRIALSRAMRGFILLARGQSASGRAYLLGVLDFMLGRGGIRAEYHAR
jgi:hypothetical protein